jgi:hypothetical protein
MHLHHGRLLPDELAAVDVGEGKAATRWGWEAMARDMVVAVHSCHLLADLTNIRPLLLLLSLWPLLVVEDPILHGPCA